MKTGKRPQTKEQRQKQVISRLKNRIDKLEGDNRILRAENAELKAKLEKALLYIEELQKYVFRGKKKREEKNEEDDNNKKNTGSGRPRDKTSYRRPVPNESEITNRQDYGLNSCPHCQGQLNKIKILEFFEEDILPMIEWYKKIKTVMKKTIISGYCFQCGRRVSAAPIPKQRVGLGNNIKELIVFQYTVEQLSYEQIIDFCQGCLRFKLSRGEILNILEEQAGKLKSAFEDLKQEIRGQPGVHIDETSWKVSRADPGGGDFVWAMGGIKNDNILYLFGQNRGKGNVKKLVGENFNGIGISDAYGAYKNAFTGGKHALCWAHPCRKARDLKNSDSLSSDKKQLCRIFYDKFSALYEQVRTVAAQPFKKEKRLKEKEKLMIEFKKITEPDNNDPDKLRIIKESLKKQIECYFVCITEPDIPPDNNKAERALRHLVIKRKKSFGSKTQKGADIMSVLYSVVMSLWRKNKESFFENYSLALNSTGGI